MNCPAHIYPEFHWYDFEQMYDFEELYKQWLDVRSDETASAQQRNAAAEDLLGFLLENGSVNRSEDLGNASFV